MILFYIFVIIAAFGAWTCTMKFIEFCELDKKNREQVLHQKGIDKIKKLNWH